MNSRNQECRRRIEQCAKSIPSSGITERPELISHMVRLAEDVRAVYGRAAGDLETAVPYYMRRVSGDCFQVYEEEETPDAAVCAVQTLAWRTGLLIGLLAADSDRLPTISIEHIVSLVCLLVSTTSAPDTEAVEKLLAAAEGPHPKGVDDLARRILCQLTGGIGETLREKSPVCGFGHPVDSGLVNMLDTPIINGAFRALVDFNADTAMGQMLAAGIPVTETNFPQLNRIVDDCVAQLNIPRPYVIVTNQISGLNAMTFGSDQEPYIAVTSLLARIMSEPEMRFVIGHECGHIAMGHVIYHTAAATMGQFSQMIPLVGPVIARSISYPLNAWSRRSEITADRAGFLCCGDLEQSKRTLLQLESAFAPAEALDLETYMANSQRFLEQGFLRRIGEYNANHPLTPKRIRALELFSKSEAYYRASGQSIPAGALSDQDLARQTEDIVKVL